jgi:DNA-binding HxlR family transcriptional regulator
LAEDESKFDAVKAEFFEAVGHPNRIRIILALNQGGLGFAELKKKVGIGSSGHLAFHLRKLSGLVTTDAMGSYVLTDEGKEAAIMLDSVPGNPETRSPRRLGAARRPKLTKAILSILLIAIVVLGIVGAYQQEQISTLNRALYANTVEIGGSRYYFESVPVSLFNGSRITFHGVTFTYLQGPWSSYSNPGNFTYAGSVRLSNGTLLNLTGKTVVIEMNGGLFQRTGAGNGTIVYGTILYTGIDISFRDGGHETFNGFNIAARLQHAYNLIPGPVYVLTYTYHPSSLNPWFGSHRNPQVGVFWNYTSNQNALTLYVST